MLRQYMPKGTELSVLGQDELDAIAFQLVALEHQGAIARLDTLARAGLITGGDLCQWIPIKQRTIFRKPTF